MSLVLREPCCQATRTGPDLFRHDILRVLLMMTGQVSSHPTDGARVGSRREAARLTWRWSQECHHTACWSGEAHRNCLPHPSLLPGTPAAGQKCPHTAQHSTALGFGAPWPSPLLPRSWSAQPGALRWLWGERPMLLDLLQELD